MTIEYSRWLEMSEENREKLKRSWNPYEGQGSDMLKYAFERFKREFPIRGDIQSLHCGVYHGGIHVIGVTVKKGSRVRIPKKFEGFPVLKVEK